jgi:phosphate transport system substrate-binding protein
MDGFPFQDGAWMEVADGRESEPEVAGGTQRQRERGRRQPGEGEGGGSIGYVEYIYALQHQLNFGKVRNQAGKFVAASLESIGEAMDRAAPVEDDFKISIVNAPGDGAYPIASFTWMVVPARIADEAKRAAVVGFLKWMLGPGQAQSAALGYVALPKELVKREEAASDGIR